MDAGTLDQQILIETATLSTNDLGEEIATWSPHSQPWARVIEAPGREFLKSDIEAEGKAVFKIRWRSLDSKARVTWRGRIYDVQDVTGTQREGFAWLHCRSVAGAN
jgi:SPP1 family predicted phage head-tail adaptor